MGKILLLEDEESVNRGISFTLEKEGFEICSCGCLQEAMHRFDAFAPELLICDVTLPDGSGLDMVRYARKRSDVYTICLTALDSEIDQVMGYESGADDYITKPFSLMALRARVNNQIRKTRSSRLQVYQSRDFYFSFQRMEFSKGDRKVDLSRTEQKLLQLLVENRGLTLSRNELVERIWADSTQYADENALTVLVKRLRDKLEDNPGAPRYIKTVYGIGYTWADGRERLSAGAGRG